MTTGERIRFARKKAGLTQAELANKVGVKFSAIHKYETGMIVNLKRETIATLAEVLNVSPAWLMCLDDPVVLSTEEEDLIRCWRQASDKERQNIAFILRDYGMPFPKAGPGVAVFRSSGG